MSSIWLLAGEETRGNVTIKVYLNEAYAKLQIVKEITLPVSEIIKHLVSRKSTLYIASSNVLYVGETAKWESSKQYKIYRQMGGNRIIIIDDEEKKSYITSPKQLLDIAEVLTL